VVTGLAFSMLGSSVSADALESNFSFMIVETGEDGAEQLVSRGSVKPGEVIHYQLNHENTTEDAMAGLVIAAPVPEGVTITLGSESSTVPALFEVQAELDPETEGLEWSALPATRLVADASGALQEEPLPEADILAVRWSFSEALEPGASAVNGYRVRVD